MPIVALVASTGITRWQKETCEKTLELLNQGIPHFVVDAFEAQTKTRNQLLKLANSLEYPQLYWWEGERIRHLGDFLFLDAWLNADHVGEHTFRNNSETLVGQTLSKTPSARQSRLPCTSIHEIPPGVSTAVSRRMTKEDLMAETESSSDDSEGSSSSCDTDPIVVLQRMSSTVSELTFDQAMESSPRNINSTSQGKPSSIATNSAPFLDQPELSIGRLDAKRFSWKSDLSGPARPLSSVQDSSTQTKVKRKGATNSCTTVTLLSDEDDGSAHKGVTPKLFGVASGPTWLYGG